MNILERFEELTNLISASCIAFKVDAEQIYKDRDARIQEIKETFKQTSPQYQASIEQAKEQAEKQLMQARVDYSKDVIYQIITDRFYDGDKSNNPSGNLYDANKNDWKKYWGGDWKGIADNRYG